MSKRRLAQVRRLDASSPATISRDYARLVQAIEQEFDDLEGDDVGGEFDPHDYGARGDGSDDTAALQKAANAAGAAYQTTGTVQTVRLQPGRRYGIVTRAGGWAMPLLGSTTTMHIGVFMPSGVRWACEGTTFVALGAEDTTGHHALFGTAFNATVGTVERVSFDRPRFDFTGSGFTSVIYAVVAVGVSGLHMLSPALFAEGTQRGRLIKVLNSEDVKLLDIDAKNVVQVMFAGYVTGLQFAGLVDGFTEAFDMDAPCYLVAGDVVCLNGTGEAQCLDISSVQDGYFRLRCQSVGNAAILYQKTEAHATFAEWYTKLPASTNATDPVPIRRVTLEVEGNDIHSDDLRAIQVSLDRTDASFGNYWDGKPFAQDITIRGTISDTDPLLVYECERLDLDITMRDVTTGSTPRINNAAVILRQARTGATAISESKLTGRARIKVTNSSRTGVRVSGPTDFYLEADVDTYNTADDATSGVASGVWVEDLNLKNGVITLGPCRVRNGDTTVDPTDLRLTWDGSGGTIHVRDLGGHRLETSGATQRMRSGGSGSPILGGREHIFSVDTTGGTVDVTLPYVCQLAAARLANLTITNLAAVGAGGANFTSFTARRVRTGTVGNAIGSSTSYDDGARTAGTVVDMAIDGSDADGVFVAGDILALRAAQNGGGSALTNLIAKFTFVEYSV